MTSTSSLSIDLIGAVAEDLVKDLGGEGYEIGVGDPGSVASIVRFAQFVLTHLGEGELVDGLVPT